MSKRFEELKAMLRLVGPGRAYNYFDMHAVGSRR